eukprot:610929-Prymnesium_polylepis.1
MRIVPQLCGGQDGDFVEFLLCLGPGSGRSNRGHGEAVGGVRLRVARAAPPPPPDPPSGDEVKAPAHLDWHV